jgi:hypothetical protein
MLPNVRCKDEILGNCVSSKYASRKRSHETVAGLNAEEKFTPREGASICGDLGRRSGGHQVRIATGGGCAAGVKDESSSSYCVRINTMLLARWMKRKEPSCLRAGSQDGHISRFGADGLELFRETHAYVCDHEHDSRPKTRQLQENKFANTRPRPGIRWRTCYAIVCPAARSGA